MPDGELSAGYILRSLHEVPTQGSKAPWRLHQNDLLDQFVYRYSPIEDGVLAFG